MKVLLVSHRYPPVGVAGVERLSAQTAAALSGRGHEVTVLTRHTRAHPTLTIERDVREGVRVVSVGGGGDFEAFPAEGPALEAIFERMLAELSPDVVLMTHLLYHSPGYVHVAHRWRIPVVLELHDFFAVCQLAHLRRKSGDLCAGPEGGAACAEHCFGDHADPKLRWALRTRSFAAALDEADAVLVPSGYVATRFAELFPGLDVDVVANAVDDVVPSPRPDRPPGAPLHLASIGPTVEHKGFSVAVEGMRMAGIPVRYTVFGVAVQPGGVELYEAAEEAPKLDLRLFGEFEPSQLPSLLADVDALLVPSIVPETFSIVTREAFACGVPVIASRIGALAEAIRHGDNGFLVEPGEPLEIAELVQRLDADRGIIDRLRKGIGAADTCSVAERVERLEAILRRACERRPHAAAGGRELALMRQGLAETEDRG